MTITQKSRKEIPNSDFYVWKSNNSFCFETHAITRFTRNYTIIQKTNSEKKMKKVSEKRRSYKTRTLSLLICSLASERFWRSAAYRKRRRRFFTTFPTASRHLFSASSELPFWFKSNSGGMRLSISDNRSRTQSAYILQ